MKRTDAMPEMIPNGLPRVWRKLGPIGWVMIVRTWLNSDPWKTDQAMPGIVIRFSDIKHTRGGAKFYWKKTEWFYPCNSIPRFIKDMRQDHRFLPKELRRMDKKKAFNLPLL